MKKVLVLIPFKVDGKVLEANKEHDLEDEVVDRALAINPNMLKIIGNGADIAELEARLEAETQARIKAEEKAEAEMKAREKAEEEITALKAEASKAKKTK